MQDQENGEKKPKFKILDRRRIDADDVEASFAPPEPEPKKAPELKAVPVDKPEEEQEPELRIESDTDEPHDHEHDHDHGQEQDPLVYMNIVFSFLQTLVSVIWVHIGLVAHPQTKLITKKLEDARKCIELFEVIYGTVREELPANLQLELDGALQDMKVNYVNQLP
ncbi:MAG: DUF1844 domain-containing protein [bacterium]|nr:DUF1844 domain-containing protein [bacterium]